MCSFYGCGMAGTTEEPYPNLVSEAEESNEKWEYQIAQILWTSTRGAF